MTVSELKRELEKYEQMGHGDTSVIAHCYSTYKFCADEENDYVEYHFSKIDDIYYQSGDIEIEFSNGKER
ncbi:MAG: hypothetical protein MJZ11_08350 [Lachnospiraceae bacterium]|nr:hypothetical protein [Lachnospiraceae bacterium]